MAFDPKNPNLKIWLENEPTDPAYTKPITGKAFKGTALNGEYVMKRLTDAFGPVGMGWGYTPTFEDVHFPSGKSLNFCTLRFWYFPNGCSGSPGEENNLLSPIGERAEFTQVGGTELAGTRKSGDTYADDEARKKSITDALLKAASHIGIGGDIHLGMFDDSKYVNDRAADEKRAGIAIARTTADDSRAVTLRDAQATMDELAACETEGDFAEQRGIAAELLPKLRAIDATKAEFLIAGVKDAALRLGIELRKTA